jgi:hypothetical protein
MTAKPRPITSPQNDRNPKPEEPMTTYTKSPTKTLAVGDKVVFKTPKGTLTGVVTRGFTGRLFVNFPDSNSLVFDHLGITGKEAFCEKAYGYAPKGGSWPETDGEDYPALTRAVRAVFNKCRKPTKAELAKQRADEKHAAELERKRLADAAAAKAKADAERAAKRAALPAPARAFLSYMDANPDAFGRQRRHVTGVLACVFGVDSAALV